MIEIPKLDILGYWDASLSEPQEKNWMFELWSNVLRLVTTSALMTIPESYNMNWLI